MSSAINNKVDLKQSVNNEITCQLLGNIQQIETKRTNDNEIRKLISLNYIASFSNFGSISEMEIVVEDDYW